MRRLCLHRPSAATVISLVALFFAMSGTAVAATGGDFILGKSNTATSVSSLSNSKGTALKLSSSSTTPPLTVSNSVQVPNLNASELDGQTSSAFLGVNGTAANSAELGGQPASAYLGVNGTAANSAELGGTPASGYMQGGGHSTGARMTLHGDNNANFLDSPGANISAYCDRNGVGSGVTFALVNSGGTQSGASAFWWNKDGVGFNNTFPNGAIQLLTPGNGSTAPYVVVVQVDNITSISTFTLSEEYTSNTDTCYFTGQVVTTSG